MDGNSYTQEHLRLIAKVLDGVSALHAEVVAQRYDYESFGSWSLVLRTSGSHVRVDFDGRDRVLLGYKVPPPGERSAAPSQFVAEQSLSSSLTNATLFTVMSFIERCIMASNEAQPAPRNAV